MERAEALELLRESAREISSHVEWLQGRGLNRLAECATVWHLVNFKVQNIVEITPKEEAGEALNLFEYDLTMKMIFHRDNRIERIAELYAAALDGFGKARGVISDYLIRKCLLKHDSQN